MQPAVIPAVACITPQGASVVPFTVRVNNLPLMGVVTNVLTAPVDDGVSVDPIPHTAI